MLHKTLSFLSVLILGLFAGAMVLIALGLQPYWNSLAPENYRDSFKAMGPFVGLVMLPLLFGSVLFSASSAVLNRKLRMFWAPAFALVFLILPLYALVHNPVNASIFGSAVIPTSEIAQMRSSWAFWHSLRTLLGVGAFGLALFAFSRESAPRGE